MTATTTMIMKVTAAGAANLAVILVSHDDDDSDFDEIQMMKNIDPANKALAVLNVDTSEANRCGESSTTSTEEQRKKTPAAAALLFRYKQSDVTMEDEASTCRIWQTQYRTPSILGRIIDSGSN